MAQNFRTPLAAMSEDQKAWFATAIVSMVLADGSVTRGEVESMVQSIGFVRDEQVVSKLKKYIQFQTKPDLGVFHGWEKQVKNRAMMLLDLMDVAIADRELSPKEREQFMHVGKLLGFPRAKVEELMQMGEKSIESVSAAEVS